MPLTSQELADVEKHLHRLEKAAKAWRITRWVVLFAGLAVVGMGIRFFVAVLAFSKSLPADASAPVTRGDLSIERTLVLSYSLGHAAALFMAFLGASLLVWCLLNWRKGRERIGLIRLARSAVEAERSKVPDLAV